MNVNGISGYSQLSAYSAYAKQTSVVKDTTTQTEDSEIAAVYEKSAEAVASENADTVTVSTDRSAIIEQLQADSDAAKNQLMSYVEETLMGQGNAIASADDVWQFLASGNYTVDEAAKEEAQKAISEGGYWSAEETADRIVEFAKTLTGGDTSKIETMRQAIEDGFSEATKSWGSDLPDITNDTYDLIQQKLDAWANGEDE